MTEHGMDRRQFLKMGMAAGAVATTMMAFPQFTLADIKKTTLDDCIVMTPDEMAKASRLVTDSMKYLDQAITTINNS